jgi:hypothetical protein
MTGRQVRSAFGIWLLLLVVAVIAGALRESLLTPRLGGQAAHVIGTLVVAIVMAAIITIYVRRNPTLLPAERWAIRPWSATTAGQTPGWATSMARRSSSTISS